MRETLTRSLTSARTIGALTVIAVISLVLSTYVVVEFAQSQSQREQERIEADVEACERANRLRTQIIDIAEAQRELVNGILRTVFDEAPPERVDEAFAPVFDDYTAQVDAIDLVDCDHVTPGATSTSLPTEEP